MSNATSATAKHQPRPLDELDSIEVGIPYLKSWELERIYREEGLEKARQERLEQGTSALIKTCCEFGISKELAGMSVYRFPSCQNATALAAATFSESTP